MDTIINSYLTSLNNIGRVFCNYSAGIFVQSSLLVILLLLIDFLLRKRVRATLRYWIWMLVFIKLVLPPTLCLPTGIGYWCGDFLSSDSAMKLVSTTEKKEYVEIPVIQDFPETVEAPLIEQPSEFAEVPQISPPMAEIETAPPVLDESPALNPVTWQAIVFLIWLVGILIISVLLVQRVLFVRGLVAQSKPSDEGLTEIMNQCRGSLDVRRNIELRLSANISSPAVCGLINPAVLVPQNLIKKLSPDKLKAVLIHELAHIKRGDLWINLTQTILQIIYFYNPFVWMTNIVVRRIREQAVDEMVLVALGAEAKSYSNTLIDIAEMAFVKTSLSLRLIGVVESKKALRQRIRRILTRPFPKSARLGLFGLLTIIAIAVVLLPMAKGNTDDSTLIVKQYRLKHPISQREMSVMINEISRIPTKGRASRLWKEITGGKRSNTFSVWGFHTPGKIICIGTKRQHARVRKFLRKEYGDLLRPPKMYDMDDVVDIDTFANTLSTIVKDIVTKLNFRFLTEEHIDYIAEDLRDFVRTYTRSDVSKETQLQILEALDAYLYSTFISSSTYERQRVYLSMDQKIKTLKLKLWQVIAVEPLTDTEITTLKKQKRWIYNFIDEHFPQATQMEKVSGMNRIGRVFNDILNGFSRQPMSAQTFSSLQNEIRNEHSISGIATTASGWSTDIAKEYYREHTKSKTEWLFPFGVVTGYSGRSDRVDFSFKSEKPRLMRMISFSKNYRCVYDVASKRGFDIPKDCTTAAKLHQWLNEQDKGDIYYEPQAKSIVTCRGAKMAVLDVNNWIDADVIPTEQLRNIIREKPISRFSVSGFKSLNDVSMEHGDKPVIPIIAVENKKGDIALIRPYDLSVSDREIDVKIRHRFDGWRDLWFASFITGQLNKPAKISKTTHSIKSKNYDSTFTATLPNGVTVELIGVCEHPSHGKQWWRPDGSLLSYAPYESRGGQPIKNSDEKSNRLVEFAVSFIGEQSSYTDVCYQVSGAIRTSGGGDLEPSPEEVIKSIACEISKSRTVTEVRLGIAAGQWKTIIEYDGSRGGFIGSDDIIFSNPIETKLGTIIAVRGEWGWDGARRIIAIDKNGNTHTGGWSGRSTGLKTLATTEFYNVKPEQIQKYQLQFRPYEWATFENVSLQPGHETNVQADAETNWVVEDYGQTRLLSGKELIEVDNWVSIVASVVKNNGRYLVPDRGLTLKDLVKAAGYNKDMLTESYIDIIRRTRQDNLTLRSIYSRNLKTLFSGEESDIVLRPHDSVLGGYIMPSSNAEEFWGQYSFGDVIELMVNDDGAGVNFLADLDTGELITPPDKIMDGDENTALRWIKDNGIDIMGETAESVNGLIGFNIYAARVDNFFWDANPLEFTDRLLVRIDDPVLLSVEDRFPVTYLIKTSKYKLGILQILGFTENPKGIKIRYKLLDKQTASKPDTQLDNVSVVGDWQYIGPAIPPDFNDIMILTEHIELGSIGHDAEGKTFITFIRDGQEAQNKQYRFVLFTKDGRILEPDGHLVLDEGKKLEEKFTFDAPFITRQLKGFRFQIGPLPPPNEPPPSEIDNASLQLQKSTPVYDFETIIPSDLAPPGRYAVELDGVDDYLLVPDSQSLRLEPPFTIEMWIKTKLPPDASEYRGGWALISKGFTVGTPRAYLTGFGINLDRFQNEPSNLQIDFCKANNSGTYSATYAGYPLKNGVSEWLYIHHVFEGKYYKSTPGHPLVMGKFLIPTENPFKGLLGEVRLWNGARTRQELREYKNVALTGNEPGLAACWTFEQTEGQFAYDISPNRNHARLGKFTSPDNADPKWIDLQAPSPEAQLQSRMQF